MMKLSITDMTEKRDNIIEFTLKGSDLKMANLLRRYIISMVPVLAVQKVTFYDNSSSYFDEYISHRMGLIPITTPKSTIKSAEFVLVVDERGPKKVTSGDMKSPDGTAKVAVENIPLITLAEDQAIRAEAKVVLGDGKTHAKFQAGTVTYDQKQNGDIVFRLESFYQIKPKDLFLRAIEILEKDLASVEKAAV